MKRDEGAIAINWVTKMVIAFAVLGFLGYDAVSLVTTKFSASDRANTLASTAADDMKSNKDVNVTYALIKAQAQTTGDTIRPQDFRVSTDGHVTLVLTHTMHSLWMHLLPATRTWTTVKATGLGAPPS